ncbi:MAG TPA: CRISPR-associated endonuclease Cas2 [Tepiditoga sp.]|nr:CRISPR-associated endonuclease Cas2 [Thermotogota bacterium]HOO74588.1 CRISPR-associated endonuclease Cas2 [Tepiditoga sp.]
MFVILTYDVNTKRVSKVHKLLKKYLTWIQNSAYEGNITEAKFDEMIKILKRTINNDEDSVIIYKTTAKNFIFKEVKGIEKNKFSFIV